MTARLPSGMTIDVRSVPREIFDARFQLNCSSFIKVFLDSIPKKYRYVPFNLISAYQPIDEPKGVFVNTKKNQHPQDAKVYIIGSGISSLASAVYLEKDARIPGKNIHIFENEKISGGACDGTGNK